MNQKRDDEKYTEQEAQRRFLGTLKAALNTPPKPLKSMARKGAKVQPKKRTERSSRKKT